ncbi:GTPase [Spelaeicoccus albus]|uniref:GTP-binding protein EngB required for normal cell division n=1 Tax=Spelaeicoccus albus TaxID=1280376 RepID=A0A7Z0IIX5_9MICO|nr:GTPase [Spelaeicoccus albus]NYI68943.1 GTP-binding protein EngB required for normal cell division [Spelaeicoccus albus]
MTTTQTGDQSSVAAKSAEQSPASDRIDQRLAGIETALRISRSRFSPGLAREAGAAVRKTRERMELGLGHTVVALAGATGSGKSSMFNAVTGLDITRVGARRPTTSVPTACVWGPGGDEVLEWLKVPANRRTRRESALDADDQKPLHGLILLDLPDYDSVATAHRAESDRLVGLVDLLIWVVDPQKYADARLHENYLQPMASNAKNMLVVLNQIDTLTRDEQDQCRTELARLLADGGLSEVPLELTSARTGAGIRDVRARLAAAVQEGEVSRRRVAADLGDVGDRMRAELGEPGPAVDELVRTSGLSDALSEAAGVPAIEETVRTDYVRRSYRVTGWPPLTWMQSARPDPLGREHGEQDRADLIRASTPAPTKAQHARVSRATRELGEQATRTLSGPWKDAVSDAERAGSYQLGDTIDQAVTGVTIPTVRPGWWQGVRLLQWLALLVTVAGIVWLIVGAFTGGVGPAAIFLTGGGIVGSIILCLIAAAARRSGARRRADEVGAELRAAVEKAAGSNFLAPVIEVLSEHDEAYRALRS